MAMCPTCGHSTRWRTTKQVMEEYHIGKTKLYGLRKRYPAISRKPFGRRLWDSQLLERLIEEASD
ncbi:MAG: hypothetical protein JNJ73_03635 [Hyphomonadaceae bacterium]|nr:hypothetical protein [Hyphomonadaceae bacterium]